MASRILIGTAFVCVITAVALAERLEETTFVPYEDKAIQYFETVTTDAVRQLDDRIEAGKDKLDYEPGPRGYLKSLLKKFDINPDSQVFIFAPDSFQAKLISPQHPRAVYFNDEYSVGFVPRGEVYEISALDKTQGVIFYSLETQKVAKPSFARREVCLQCHQGGHTLGIPGLVVSSQYTPKGAEFEHSRGGFVTDHRTTMADRWGGWYISGLLPNQKHQGVPLNENPDTVFDTSPYLLPTGDVVATMTLEHQSRMTNVIVRVAWDTRIAQAAGKLKEAEPKIDAAIEDLVSYMLFVDEAPLAGPVTGASTFSKTFPGRGPRDKQGRSLRDFDLQTRLFKYPLSYMIYTKAFDNMPEYDRERIYQKLYGVLSGTDKDPKFSKLAAEDRANVLAILRDTKPNLPAYFKAE